MKKEFWVVVPKDSVITLDTDTVLHFDYEPTADEIVDELDARYSYGAVDYPDGCLIFKAVKQFDWPVTKGTISDI